MQVKAYWNIHRKLWSVVWLKTGKVIAHAGRVDIKDVTCVVQPAGQAKVRREQTKTVHAWCKGTLVGMSDGVHLTEHGEVVGADSWVDVPRQLVTEWPKQTIRYNPYNTDTFVDTATGQPTHKLDGVIMGSHRKVFKAREYKSRTA